MSHGARDYYFWDMPISVPNGGTGCTSLTLNGVLIGQGGNGIFVTAAGTANQVLRVPSGGGAPVFSSLGALADMATLDLSSAYVINILPVAHGGSGTNAPALVAGTGISITGTWPAQTINSTSNYATLADPLPIAHGGTGTTTPGLIAGTGISISGVWPGQTITNTSNYAALADPLPIAHGGTGTTTPALVAGTGISISGSWPAQTITNTSAYATLGDPLPVAHGGTGTATPALTAGVGISITGSWPVQTITNTSAYATLADPLPIAHGGTGAADGSFTSPGAITLTAGGTNQSIILNPSGTGIVKLVAPASQKNSGANFVVFNDGVDDRWQFKGDAGSGSELLINSGIAIIQANGYLALNPGAYNVGIGVTTPAHRLEVAGTVGISGVVTLTIPLAVASGGTGTASPSLVAGTGISISGTWPAQTITNTSAYATLADPLPIAHGGTGTTTPALVAGTNISITGSWPNQTVSLVTPPIKLGTAGTPNEDAIEIGNSSSPGWTQIGATVATVSGIAGSLFGLANKSVAWRVAFDLAGNLGLAGTLTLGTPLAVTSGGTGVATCTAGQILIGSGSNTAAFRTPDGARVYNSAAESTTSTVWLPLTFDSERYNNGAMHSTVTNPSRLTCKTAGVFSITGCVEFASNATGYRRVEIVANGGTVLDFLEVAAINGDPTRLSIATLWHLSVNDYVELWAYQNSGGALNVSAVGNYSPEFAAQWLGP